MAEVFDKTLRALAASAQMRQLKQGVLSSNIANAETPGYKAKKIDFEGELARALKNEGMAKLASSEPGHFSVGESELNHLQPEIYDNPEVEVSNDGNTVDLQREMSEMLENNIMYRAATQLINKKLATLKYAANDGGR